MKLTPEQQKLKDFVDRNFPWTPLRQAGFWGTEMRRGDFQRRAARVCTFYGYQSIYEYPEIELTEVAGGRAAVVTSAGVVTQHGEYQPGITALLTIAVRRP